MEQLSRTPSRVIFTTLEDRMFLNKKIIPILLLIISLPIKTMENNKQTRLSALKSSLEKPFSGFLIDCSKFIINQHGLAYGTVIASTFGHELGHAAIPLMYGGRVKISVDFKGNGYCAYSYELPLSKAKIAHKLSALNSCLGPMAGITTSLGILAASNVYYAYNNPYSKHTSTKERIQVGVQRSLINEDQQIGLIAGTMANCLRQANQLKLFKGPIREGHQTFSDGQGICNDFRLSPKKALWASRAMRSIALVPLGYLLKQSYETIRNSF